VIDFADFRLRAKRAHSTKGRAKVLRDLIASVPDERFSIRNYFVKKSRSHWDWDTPEQVIEHTCGTAACVAGWGKFLFDPKMKHRSTEELVADKIGLNQWFMGDMFRPEGYDYKRRYTRDAAVRMLDHFIATGEVDWDRAILESKAAKAAIKQEGRNA
jgi:hypothetical protein